MKIHSLMLTVALGFVLPLGGCQTLGPPSQADNVTRQTVEYTCAAATTALNTAIAFNAKLTPAQRSQVTAATKILDPICSQPTVPSVSSTVFAGIKSAAGNLAAIAAIVAPAK